MLTLTALVKQFGTNRAVDGLSLSVGKGEVFGLLGPNGAGKSTTVHMAVGLVEPTSGQVDVGGLGSPRQPAVRARIGVAPQALSLYELLTAEENLTLLRPGLRDAGGAPRRRASPGRSSSSASPIAGAICVDTYSGGMKRRLNLAAAILHDPDLVLLDEPTVGVDPAVAQRDLRQPAGAEARRARPSSTRRTTWRRPSASAIAWRSSITASCSALDTVHGLVATHGGPPTLILRTDGGRGAHRDARSAGRAQSPGRGPRRGDAGRVPGGDADAGAGLPAPDRPLAARLTSRPIHEDTRPWLPYSPSRCKDLEAAVPGQGRVVLHDGLAAHRRDGLRRAVRRQQPRPVADVHRHRRRGSDAGVEGVRRRAGGARGLRRAADVRRGGDATWSAAAAASARCASPRASATPAAGCSSARPRRWSCASIRRARPRRRCSRASCSSRRRSACRRCSASTPASRGEVAGMLDEREEAAGGQHPRAGGRCSRCSARSTPFSASRPRRGAAGVRRRAARPAAAGSRSSSTSRASAAARGPGQRLPDHVSAGHAVGHPRLHDVVRDQPRRRADARHADAAADVAGAGVGAARRQGPGLLHGDPDRGDVAGDHRRGVLRRPPGVGRRCSSSRCSWCRSGSSA